MNNVEIREGDYVRVLHAGQSRVARVETLTAGRELAQCSWTERSGKHYVICPARALTKVPALAASARDSRPR